MKETEKKRVYSRARAELCSSPSEEKLRNIYWENTMLVMLRIEAPMLHLLPQIQHYTILNNVTSYLIQKQGWITLWKREMSFSQTSCKGALYFLRMRKI